MKFRLLAGWLAASTAIARGRKSAEARSYAVRSLTVTALNLQQPLLHE
jgi:hypothetical protein